MPIFEYICKDCNRKFEELIQDRSLMIACPQCKSTNVNKLLSVFAATSGAAEPVQSCGSPNCCGGIGCDN